ncbi:hypothetical protein LguiB_018388 [Lonicera macranthoides]
MEPSPPVVAKRLWSIVRIVFYMMRKEVSKTKLFLDLPMMLKRSKLAGKAIGNLMLQHHHHYAALGCRSDDIRMSYVSAREYEFSCSNSPAFPSYFPKRKHHHHHHHHLHHHGRRQYHSTGDDIYVVKKVFDILNNYDAVEASPLTLPGFGRSPTVRQLRVTDSPFSVKDTEDNPQVDKAAEDFIEKFYKELKQQNRMIALDSPSPYHKWVR